MMKSIGFIGVLICCNGLLSCAQHKNASSKNAVQEDMTIAFPGAEGFGKYTTGGRGGKVFVVTNLNADGEGSLRNAVVANGAKIIVFTVSGTIHLKEPLFIKENTTIAGQTAPGDGICIADYPVQLSGDNIIIRYMRFRLGDRYQNGGKVHGSGHDDALSSNKRKNIIIDHCSFSWSTDEALSVYNGDSTTLQWNLISEPLNYSYHFESGGNDFQQHGYGGIWGGKHLSAHHNLFAHCVSRTPRFSSIKETGSELVDFRNNVIYNWRHNNAYGGEGGTYNIVNNFYKAGPATNNNVQFRIVNPSRAETIPFGKYYVSGNFVHGSSEVTNNNFLGIHMGNGREADKNTAVVQSPFSVVNINNQSATTAFEEVMAGAGASLRRDTLDQRIINDVRKGTGKIIDVQGGHPHGTSYEKTVQAWPVLRSVTAPKDSDGDGMPDDWEKKHGLNPSDARDASQIKLHKRYTNIEVYINSLIK